MCVLIVEGEDGKDSSDKSEVGQTAGTETARSRQDSLADSLEGLEERSRPPSEDGKLKLMFSYYILRA